MAYSLAVGKVFAIKIKGVVGKSDDGDSASNEGPYALRIVKATGNRKLNTDKYYYEIVGTQPRRKKKAQYLLWSPAQKQITRELNAGQVAALERGERVPVGE